MICTRRRQCIRTGSAPSIVSMRRKTRGNEQTETTVPTSTATGLGSPTSVATPVVRENTSPMNAVVSACSSPDRRS